MCVVSIGVDCSHSPDDEEGDDSLFDPVVLVSIFEHDIISSLLILVNLRYVCKVCLILLH